MKTPVGSLGEAQIKKMRASSTAQGDISQSLHTHSRHAKMPLARKTPQTVTKKTNTRPTRRAQRSSSSNGAGRPTGLSSFYVCVCVCSSSAPFKLETRGSWPSLSTTSVERIGSSLAHNKVRGEGSTRVPGAVSRGHQKSSHSFNREREEGWTGGRDTRRERLTGEGYRRKCRGARHGRG